MVSITKLPIGVLILLSSSGSAHQDQEVDVSGRFGDFHPSHNGRTSNKYHYDARAKDYPDSKLLIELLANAARVNPDKIAFQMPILDPRKEGWPIKRAFYQAGHHVFKWRAYTYKEYYDLAMDAAAAFLNQGLKPMDAVNIKGLNSAEWLIAFMGCVAAGGLPVGLYPTDSLEALKYKMVDSGAKFVVVGGKKDADKYASILDPASPVKLIVWGEETMVAKKLWGGKAIPWDSFIKLGHEDSSNRQLAESIASNAFHGAAASVVYTSGTTGDPKGAMLSHDTLTWSADLLFNTVASERAPGGDDRIISYLPLNHVAGQTIDILGPLARSQEASHYMTVYFPPPCFIKKVCFKEIIKDAKPTIFFGVPEVWDGLKQKLEMGLGEGIGKVVKNIIGAFSTSAMQNFVKKKVGLHKVIYSGSGAGAITKETVSFFHDLGLDILNVFGQTESSCVGTGWTMDKFRLDKAGSIGPPSANTAFRIWKCERDDRGEPIRGTCAEAAIGEDGEIQTKGRHVMLGYLNQPEKTSKAITADGWLMTGDLGRIDADGFVWITGRIKEIMKTSGGEMIAPNAIEAGIKQTCNKPGKTIIKQAICVGDNKPFPAILFTLVEQLEDDVPTGELIGYARKIDPAVQTVAAAATSAAWEKELSTCIAEYNKIASKGAERVFRYAILPKDVTRADAELMTSTFKIKRRGIDTRYQDLIESCYADPEDRAVKPCKRPVITAAAAHPSLSGILREPLDHLILAATLLAFLAGSGVTFSVLCSREITPTAGEEPLLGT